MKLSCVTVRGGLAINSGVFVGPLAPSLFNVACASALSVERVPDYQ